MKKKLFVNISIALLIIAATLSVSWLNPSTSLQIDDWIGVSAVTIIVIIIVTIATRYSVQAQRFRVDQVERINQTTKKIAKLLGDTSRIENGISYFDENKIVSLLTVHATYQHWKIILKIECDHSRETGLTFKQIIQIEDCSHKYSGYFTSRKKNQQLPIEISNILKRHSDQIEGIRFGKDFLLVYPKIDHPIDKYNDRFEYLSDPQEVKICINAAIEIANSL